MQRLAAGTSRRPRRSQTRDGSGPGGAGCGICIADQAARLAVKREQTNEMSQKLVAALKAAKDAAQSGAERRDASRSPMAGFITPSHGQAQGWLVLRNASPVCMSLTPVRRHENRADRGRDCAGQLLTVGHLCPFPQLFSVAVGCAVYRHPPSSSPPFLRGCSRPVRRPSDARASTGLHCSMLRPTASFLCRLPSSRIKCVSALHFSAWPLQGGPRPCKPTDLQVLSLARSRLSRLASADPLCVARTGIIIHYTVYDVLHRYRARRRDACWSLAECIADAVTATPARIRLVLTRPISGLPTPQLALTTAQATPGARAVGLPSGPLMCR